MFQRIFVPLDGSPGAERAIPVAASLARRTHSSLLLFHMISTAALRKNLNTASSQVASSSISRHSQNHVIESNQALEGLLTEAANYLAGLPQHYARELADLPVEMEVTFADPPLLLSSAAKLERADLIVLCSHREIGLGQWGLESTAGYTMRQSPVPLLILNEHAQTTPFQDETRPLRIVVPLDGSLFAEHVLEPAWHLLMQGTSSQERELRLVHVVDLFAGARPESQKSSLSPQQARQDAMLYLQGIVQNWRKRAQEAHVKITCQVTSGVDIASAILDQCESGSPTSLIALATHGREGLERLARGSIAERLLNATNIPLLTVCPATSTVHLMDLTFLAEKKAEPPALAQKK